MKAWRRMLLWSTWALFLAIGLLSLGVLLQETLRSKYGMAQLQLDLATASDKWQQQSLQPWGGPRYHLGLRSHDMSHATQMRGPTWRGRVEVELIDPAGHVHRHWLLDGKTLPYQLSSGQAYENLGELRLGNAPWRTWLLRARVIAPDPAFARARSVLRLGDPHPDPGMGGMLIYLLILPGAIGLLVALLAAGGIAMQGERWPLAVTAVLALLLLAAIFA